MTQVTVFPAGLSALQGARGEHGLNVPRLPALETIIARGSRTVLAGPLTPEAVLFDLFGAVLPPAQGLPVAAVTHHIDFDGDHDGAWMRADPVHLRADMSRLLLFDAGTFSLRDEEARELVAMINAHVGADGIRLQVGREPKRWYVPLPRPPVMRTTPPLQVCGQSVASALPTGTDAGRWQRLANEIQMLLHGSPINQRRAARGEPVINSVWWWGSGAAPAVTARKWDVVGSNEPLAMGLATLAGSDAIPMHDDAAVSRFLGAAPGQSRLIVLNHGREAAQRGDLSAWSAAMTRLERLWFAPLLAELRQGTIDRLCIHTGGAIHLLRRRDSWRFWRRRRPLRGPS